MASRSLIAALRRRSAKSTSNGAAALGIATPLLWLVGGTLHELDRRQEVAALLEAASCDQRDEAIVEALLEAEERFDVDPVLLVAVAMQESTCSERAIGAGGSRGLLQLRPETARDVARRHRLGWSDSDRLYQADYNILVGAAHLAELYRELGTWGAALSAYNLGETRYRALARRHGGTVTSRYARSVLRRRGDLEELVAAER